MKNTKEKGYPNKNGIFEKIMNNLAKNLIRNFRKNHRFYWWRFKSVSPSDINLDTLGNQTKYSTAVKCLLNNKDLTKNIHELYKADNLPIKRRKNISTIYNNLMKNTYNVDAIFEEYPEANNYWKIIKKRKRN